MKLKNIIIALSLMFVAGATVLVPVASATTLGPGDPGYRGGASGAGDGVAAVGPDRHDAPNRGTQLTNLVSTIINITLFIVGILAVIMIIVGGIRYQTSGGDPAKVKAAQQTLTYAIVGLIVAILAFAIVNFIVARL